MKRLFLGNGDRSASQSFLLAFLIAIAAGTSGGSASADDFSIFPRPHAADVSGWYTFDEFQEMKGRFSFRQTYFPRSPDAFIEIPVEETPSAYPDLYTYVAEKRLAWETDEEDENDRQFREIVGGDFRFQYLERHKEFPVLLGPDSKKARKWGEERHKSQSGYDCVLYGSDMWK